MWVTLITYTVDAEIAAQSHIFEKIALRGNSVEDAKTRSRNRNLANEHDIHCRCDETVAYPAQDGTLQLYVK